jgi:hypothetical protein
MEQIISKQLYHSFNQENIFMKNTIIYTLLATLFFTSCKKECAIDDTLTQENSSVTILSSDKWEGYTDIVINASTEEVWDVLKDYDNMPNWSSTLQGIVGDIRNGGAVTTTYLLANPITGVMSSLQSQHTLIYEEGVLFGWSDPFELSPGSGVFITDNHRYKVEAISECQTRFIQTDDFTGTIPAGAGITVSQMSEFLVTSYKQFNQELKAEVEK